MRTRTWILLACVSALLTTSAFAQEVAPGPQEDAVAVIADPAPSTPDIPKGITTTAVAEDLYITTPTGTPPNPDVTASQLIDQGKEAYKAFKDGKVLAGIGIVLSLVLTLLLKLIAFASKSPAFMAKDWFRKAVPIATFALSTILVLFLTFTMKVPIDDMITAVIGVATGAIAWWETVGQHLFKKPKELADESDS